MTTPKPVLRIEVLDADGGEAFNLGLAVGRPFVDGGEVFDCISTIMRGLGEMAAAFGVTLTVDDWTRLGRAAIAEMRDGEFLRTQTPN